MLRRAPHLQVIDLQREKSLFLPFTFLLPFFYQQRPVDNRVSEAKPEAKQPYLAPQRGGNGPHLTHRPQPLRGSGERGQPYGQPKDRAPIDRLHFIR